MKNTARFILPFKGGRFNWVKIAVYLIVALVYILRKFGIIQGDVEELIQALLKLFGL